MKEEILKLRDPEYWENIWEKSKTHRDHPESDGPAYSVELWEKRAEKFKSNVKGERGKKRTDEVIIWLENQGVTLEGMKILDIGAGPGAFSFAFAEKNAEVTALEPTTAMSSFIKEQIQNEGKIGVTVVQESWEDVDVEKMGWTEAFDLVFISMCPGVHNAQLFKKAMSCAKKYLYFSGWAGRRDSEAFGELWKELYGEEILMWRSDIIYNLNWLYTQGYNLAFEVKQNARPEELNIESAVEEFMSRLNFYGKDTIDLQEKVAAFVNARSENGILKTNAVSRRGKILVKL
ncbi:methyltransferase domain-containing protein [Acetobacterium paludosum]|uniref:Methyltransferase domain-containing protein n=1 Tax=Acetobacterium paludosum TaxID=52693 RepID=A0A923KQE6_9FIRM|nr:class I SAM-dependent methyltransferase [Acetobacterium paludosum]MBC3889069.1 methyltransferase domain-containing protein [Acetobacterium paludosum]